MLPALIIIPSLLLTVLFTILIWQDIIPNEYKWIVLIPLAIVTGTFVTRRILLEWWHTKYPSRLANKEKEILEKFVPYYAALSQEMKLKFEERMSLFRLQKVFQMRGAETLPGDMQLLVSAMAVQITLGLEIEKEIFPRLGAIILFPKTFITPHINKELHAVEFNEDADTYDSLFLAINTFASGIKKAKNFYNIGLYGFALVLKSDKQWKDEDIPYDTKELLAKLHVMRNFPIGYIFKYTATYNFDVLAMAIEHFFNFPEQMKEELPDVYSYLQLILKQNPANKENPLA